MFCVATPNVSHDARRELALASAILGSMKFLKIAAWILVAAAAISVSPMITSAKEARPPKWSRDVLDTFFDDARETLDGERPDYEAQSKAPGSAAENEIELAERNAASEGHAISWSQLITAETLETETKRLAQSLNQSVTTPSSFKGGGFKDARRDLSELAILFAVTAQYDGDARWKNVAADLRDSFTRAAANAKVGSDATYREASARKQDLADLIRGSRPQLPKAPVAVDDWSHVAARPPLMQRLNIAHQERLTKWLADETTFRRQQVAIAHEAQVVALIAEVIHQPDYEFSDDETFVGYADDLRRAASDVSAAATANNFQQARDAIGRATGACANCHDGYRG